MSKQIKRAVAGLALIPLLAVLLSGCWDNEELHTLYIVTGVALDKAVDPEQMDITVQIAKSQSKETSGPDGSGSQGHSVILLQTTRSTMMEGLMDLNQNSNRHLLRQHNKVLLLGSELAEQGIRNHIDLFMRNRESRMEVLVMVVQGRAEDALYANLEQDTISAMFLSNMIKELSQISQQYMIRMLDFSSRFLEETTAPLAPLIQVSGEEDKQEIRIIGLAVFKEDKMIGRLNPEEMLGYMWTMGKVKESSMSVNTDLGKAAFQIIHINTKREVKLRPDGGVQVALDVDARMRISELHGFGQTDVKDLIPYLTEAAKEEIRQRIIDTFEEARELNADIYGFGTSVYRKYPKEWKTMKGRWDEIFPDTQVDVQVEVQIPGTGQIVQSVEMEVNRP